MQQRSSTHRRARLDLAALRQFVSAQESSGLSVKDFCAGQGLSAASFYQWRKRLEGDQASAGQLFSPIEIEQKPTGSIGVELPGGLIVRFEALPPVEYLRSLSLAFNRV